MKKKGLIVATIVMVLVLAVSLTTATYAWFSAQATANVEQITLSTSAADGLLIGIHGTNSSTNASEYQSYVNGASMTYSLGSGSHYAGSWANYDSTGFGTDVAFETISALNAQYGVQYTTTALDNGESDELQKHVDANNWFKASGSGSSRSNLDLDTISYADANTDFIVMDLGCTPSKNSLVKQAWVDIEVSVPDVTNPGMAAAVCLAFAANSTSAFDKACLSSLTTVDGFSGMTQTNGYDAEDLDAGSIDAVTGAGKWTYSIELYNAAAFMQKNSTIGRLYLVIFLDGDDDACIISNLGTGCDIDIKFGYSGTQSEYTIFTPSTATASHKAGERVLTSTL